MLLLLCDNALAWATGCEHIAGVATTAAATAAAAVAAAAASAAAVCILTYLVPYGTCVIDSWTTRYYYSSARTCSSCLTVGTRT